MNHRFVSWLIKFYPRDWRAEYGPELEELLQRQPLSVPAVGDVLAGALRQRLRQPSARFLVFSIASCAIVFSTALLFAGDLWRMLVALIIPMPNGLVSPPVLLISGRPWEQFQIVWFGVPSLLTFLGLYPIELWLAWHIVARFWDEPDRRVFRSFAIYSGLSFLLGLAVSSLVLHQIGFGWLIAGFARQQNARLLLPAAYCFALLTSISVAAIVGAQIPVLVMFGRRLKAIYSKQR